MEGLLGEVMDVVLDVDWDSASYHLDTCTKW